MNLQVLRKLLPLTLSAGMVFTIPAVLPQELPAAAVSQAEAAKAKGTTWSFQKDLDGWKYGGKWAYHGKPQVTQSKEFGGTLKLDVDYSGNVNDSWSEVKLEDGAASSKPLDAAGCNVVGYDLYFNPKAMTAGGFKTKVYAKSTTGREVINVYPDIDMTKAKDAGNGMKVVRVQVQFTPTQEKLNYLMVSLVGSNTDYKGSFYIKDMNLSYQKLPDGYVDKKVSVKPQKQTDLSKLDIPATVSLVDGKASVKTAQMYAYMKGIADSDLLLYGHQNEMHRKVSKLSGASDTYDIVKDYSAVVGVDGLALVGNELSLTDAERAAGITLTDKLAKISIAASHNGSILTMSCHMPNFDLVSRKPMINGHYDFDGYSPNVTSGDVVRRIMPGGDLNKVYRSYLDMVADYAGKLQAADVPLVFRPFHENNGSWFWWGAAFCSPSEYKNLFRYTVEYMRDTKGLHNLLYAYSPGGPFADTADYESRYPGDAYIDIVGFDIYHRDPAKADNWMKGFASTMDVVQAFAEQHHKLAAVTETGVLVGKSAMAKTGNQRLDWFNEALKTIAPYKMAYFMTWSNFDETNFDQPYMVTAKRGHEMINNFIDFYNQPQSVFAGQVPDYTKLKVGVEPALATYGYITGPNTMDRILEPGNITAKVAGNVGKAAFALQRKDGTIAAVLPARHDADGRCTAAISQQDLDAIGQTVGTIALQLDGKTVDSLMVLFNMKPPVADPSRVDDFDSYYGDNGLLKGAYSTNCGAGCEVVPMLSNTHNGGDAGLAFHYKINKGGYAGIIKSLKGVDWSSYRGIQFWITPDGKGQKLICQLNSNGEDFEVDLSNVTKGRAPQLVTLPFSQFKGKNGGKFDASAVQHFAFYCNTIGDIPVDSVMYMDSIKAVK